MFVDRFHLLGLKLVLIVIGLAVTGLFWSIPGLGVGCLILWGVVLVVDLWALPIVEAASFEIQLSDEYAPSAPPLNHAGQLTRFQTGRLVVRLLVALGYAALFGGPALLFVRPPFRLDTLWVAVPLGLVSFLQFRWAGELVGDIAGRQIALLEDELHLTFDKVPVGWWRFFFISKPIFFINLYYCAVGGKIFAIPEPLYQRIEAIQADRGRLYYAPQSGVFLTLETL